MNKSIYLLLPLLIFVGCKDSRSPKQDAKPAKKEAEVPGSNPIPTPETESKIDRSEWAKENRHLSIKTSTDEVELISSVEYVGDSKEEYQVKHSLEIRKNEKMIKAFMTTYLVSGESIKKESTTTYAESLFGESNTPKNSKNKPSKKELLVSVESLQKRKQLLYHLFTNRCTELDYIPELKSQISNENLHLVVKDHSRDKLINRISDLAILIDSKSSQILDVHSLVEAEYKSKMINPAKEPKQNGSIYKEIELLTTVWPNAVVGSEAYDLESSFVPASIHHSICNEIYHSRLGIGFPYVSYDSFQSQKYYDHHYNLYPLEKTEEIVTKRKNSLQNEFEEKLNLRRDFSDSHWYWTTLDISDKNFNISLIHDYFIEKSAKENSNEK